MFLPFIESAKAQIIPLQGTLTYSRSTNEWPQVIIKAANGSATYVLSHHPEVDIKDHLVHIDLVLHQPGASSNASSLLSPPHPWHGLQEYDFNASDFVNGPDKAIFGATRTVHIKRHGIVVKFHVAKVDVLPVDDPAGPGGNYVFNKLALDVDVENAK